MELTLRPIAEQVMVITGASSGIGPAPPIFGHHPRFPEFHRGSRSCAPQLK
jgi:hypothetical protein